MNENPFYDCWHLQCENGRQRWRFRLPEAFRNEVKLIRTMDGEISDSDIDWSDPLSKQFLEKLDRAFHFNKQPNPNSADLVYRVQARKRAAPANGNTALERAISFYDTLQAEDGHWPGDYGGPHFLLPGLVIASYFTQTPFSPPQQTLIKRYMLNHQNPDGGWGLHIEDHSTLFGTVMQYVALRLLGERAGEAHMIKARQLIHEHGGAVCAPSWCKFYLALLGVYEWSGCHTLIPEFWLLPEWLPVHPSHYWCHTRMVYLPMGYCYGHRLRCPDATVLQELRSELYTTAYHKIPWAKVRHRIAATDSYAPLSRLMKLLYPLLDAYEAVHLKSIRKRALKFVLDYIHAEDDHTTYIDIGPVNQVINSIAVYHACGKNSSEFQKHVERWQDYLWVAEDGMKMNGYNGSQLWDTAFAAQAYHEAGKTVPGHPALMNALRFVECAQVKEEVRDHKKFFRHDSVGGWPFSTAEHGWPITDCSAEGFKTASLLQANLPDEKRIVSEELMRANVDLLLSFQNKDGGWASYELQRAGAWLELFNPAEVFGNIMVDYSYVECTSACVQALARGLTHFRGYRTTEIKTAIQRGAQFLLARQRTDGSFIGSWAVCFTYGCWWAVEGLHAAAGVFPEQRQLYQESISRVIAYLKQQQNSDGGWGESYRSCVEKKWVSCESQVVNTAWALLSVLHSEAADEDWVHRAVEWLKARQLPDGDFPQQRISGVFNFNCMITYTSYRNVFPIWALARYESVCNSGKPPHTA